MSIPVSYSVLIQGSNLIVNYFFGPNAVILYTTTRTLSNFIFLCDFPLQKNLKLDKFRTIKKGVPQ